MVEVFKTDVKDPEQASFLLAAIHKAFDHYLANFDLNDCDNILRVKCLTGNIQVNLLIELLKDFGFTAEVLADIVQSVSPVAAGNDHAK